MVHTGAGIPFALRSMVIPIARKFPDLNIVLAHGGNNISAGEALIVAQECDNVLLEPSWVSHTYCAKICKISHRLSHYAWFRYAGELSCGAGQVQKYGIAWGGASVVFMQKQPGIFLICHWTINIIFNC